MKKLFIANRGEIAVRIIRAARKLKIKTVQGYSEADKTMLGVSLADEAICIGPAKSSESYLHVDRILAAAKKSGCDALHPGYGFLSENSAFVRALDKAGITFVGPSAQTIERMGDKVAARQVAIEAGVPVVPGSSGRVREDNEQIAKQIGFPIMIKAAAGGGGRGIRVAKTLQELKSLTKQAAREAEAAFGDGGLYFERHIKNPRHIEVQVLGDGQNVIHLFERECSLQRRRQKVWEEAGAQCLDDLTRAALCESALKLASFVRYKGAGTLEYLYDEGRKEFFFIEMNTRIQVEHPVTEMITGIDLIAEMLRIARGESLSLRQKDIVQVGHSVEVRLNAEDPFQHFLPSPGTVGRLAIPQGKGIRFDHFLQEHYQIPPYYDSLLGKLVVHAENRAHAIEKLTTTLQALTIGGIATTLPLFQALAQDKDVLENRIHTQWLENWLAAGNLQSKQHGGNE